MDTKTVIDLSDGSVNVMPLSADEQSGIDARRTDAMAALPATIIAAIKAEAARRITLTCPDWKQRNLTARAAELAIKGAANWTSDEAAEVAAGQAIWTAIKTIRARSDQLESLAITLPPDQLAALDPNDPAHWPS